MSLRSLGPLAILFWLFCGSYIFRSARWLLLFLIHGSGFVAGMTCQRHWGSLFQLSSVGNPDSYESSGIQVTGFRLAQTLSCVTWLV